MKVSNVTKKVLNPRHGVEQPSIIGIIGHVIAGSIFLCRTASLPQKPDHHCRVRE